MHTYSCILYMIPSTCCPSYIPSIILAFAKTECLGNFPPRCKRASHKPPSSHNLKPITYNQWAETLGVTHGNVIRNTEFRQQMHRMLHCVEGYLLPWRWEIPHHLWAWTRNLLTAALPICTLHNVQERTACTTLQIIKCNPMCLTL